MAGRFFMLHRVTDFAPGYFENTAVVAGSVQLGLRAGSYVETGVYTSPIFTGEAFFSLVPSWNADTPPGTSVEMEVRVNSDGQWSRWFGFGYWSPYIDRATPPPHQDEIARVAADTLTLLDGVPAAGRLQLRVTLLTQDPQHTPRVFLLAASTNATHQMRQNAPAYDRVLELPSYACQHRDPAIAGRMGSVTTLCMLINRWGRDLLPEEVARTAYDSGAGHYGNLAFLCAVAGMHGFQSYVAHSGIPALRREVWLGRAVGARVHYRAPALSDDALEEGGLTAEGELPAPPVLEGATRHSSGHIVAVRGFVKRDGVEYVVANDPIAPTDEAARREIPIAEFAKMYTGIALFLQRGPARSGASRPQRRTARLQVGGGVLRLCTEDDQELAPAGLSQLAPYTLCYTLSDGIAYASSAQRKFYYPPLSEAGTLPFDARAAAGHRMVVYLIGSRGESWVAEKTLGDAPDETATPEAPDEGQQEEQP